MEDLTIIEKLPSLIVPTIAQYLSIKDLAACCAASRTMRVLFDADDVWKPRCVRGLAEYLRTTPCQVEPAFTSPESDNSTLDNVSEWRMAFMRENHLRNNWRQNKCKKERFEVGEGERRMRPIGFLSNDHLVVQLQCGFEIQDFRISPAQPALEPVKFDRIMKYLLIKVCNGLIIVNYDSLVLVYKADYLQKKCLLCNVFFCDEAYKEPLDKSYILKLSRKQSPSFEPSSLDLVGEFVVAFNKTESIEDTMLIWNYVTGEKIKEEHCPFKIEQKWVLNSKVFCVYKEGRENTHSFIAYSLTKLAFLPLKVTVKSSIQLRSGYDVATYNNFVLIRVDDNCTIYNLETCKKLLSCECKQSSVECNYVMYDRFVFCGKDGVMKTFDPVTEILTVLPIDFINYVDFMYDRYIDIQHIIPNNQYRKQTVVWEIDRNFKIISKSIKNFLIYSKCINKAVSRCVVATIQFPVVVVSFW